MVREQPTILPQPNRNRREERARRARDTKNRIIPDLLRACPRAKHGIHKAELIVDPPAVVETPQNGPDAVQRTDLKIRVNTLDTLSAAGRISEKLHSSKRSAPAVKSRPQRPNVAVLNMASALRPGGGFLDGANSQEEFLCARTTIYPSLWDAFYRMPEVSGVYTPDVLVFRDHLPDAHDLPKNDRYFVDVISSSMLRFSDARAEGCSCGVSYCDRHRDIVLRKMKAVLRIAQSKGVEKLVLGAWGCGAHKNPVKEIAKCWRKVIAGGPRQRRPNAERWEGINEIIFAIPDRTMLYEFQAAFSDIIANDLVTPTDDDDATDTGAEMGAEEEAHTSELITRMAEIELQIEQTRNFRLKNTLRQILEDLQRELSQGANAKASQDQDLSSSEEEIEQAPEDDEIADDFVIGGYPILGSDGETADSSFYHLDHSSGLSPTSSSDPTRSEIYEFRPQAPGLTSHHASQDEDAEESADESLCQVPSQSPPQFDPETGWYTGSMEGLTAYLSSTGALGRGTESLEVDVLRKEQGPGALPGLDAEALHSYLSRYQGSDVKDY